MKFVERLIFFEIFLIIQIHFGFALPVFGSQPGIWRQNGNLLSKQSAVVFSFDRSLYISGGANLQVIPGTFSSIQNEDGTSGVWTRKLPEPNIFWNSIVTNGGFAYSVGGATFPPGNSTDEVKYLRLSDVNGPGWILLNSLSKRLHLGTAVVAGKRIYYAGGYTEPENVWNADIYVADINNDGSLSPWRSAGVLPEANTGFGLIDNNGYLVVTGGFAQISGYTTKSYFAQINEYGQLGNWNETSPLPVPLNGSGIFKSGRTLISAGGCNSNGALNKVYFADLNLDGSLGSWQTSTSDLPQPVCNGGATTLNGYAYLIGGSNADFLDTVYFTKIDYTPEPTPIPTATPTPTPVKIETTKVVLIPGMGASWNEEAILKCKADGYKGGWTLAPFAKQFYQPLIKALSKDWTVKTLYYDWRRQIPDNTELAKSFIESGLVSGEKVNLVGHSMGGLIGRAYLEDVKGNNMIDKMLTVGTPHKGVVLAYPAWSAGKIETDNLLQKIALTLAARVCDVRQANDRITLQRVIPSAQNLLPVFDYLKDKSTGVTKPVALMKTQNNWLATNLISTFWGVHMGTLSGVGEKTISGYVVEKGNKKDFALGNWIDGKPVKEIATREGDGTVLISSSQIIGSDNRVINANHTELVTTKAGINQILDFLGDKPIQNVPAEPKSALVVVGLDTNLTMIEGSVNGAEQSDNVAVIFNASGKRIKFGTSSTKVESDLLVGQFWENGEYLWRDYHLKGPNQRFAKVNFDGGLKSLTNLKISPVDKEEVYKEVQPRLEAETAGQEAD